MIEPRMMSLSVENENVPGGDPGGGGLNKFSIAQNQFIV